ncbi:hypothetical protein LK494_03170 [Anaerovorax odorimutans]|nr:hypothetical protein [Anaerovorax odorimutans]
MSYQEEFVDMMRQQGAYYNSPDLELGEMKTDMTCAVGDMILTKEEYKVLENAKGKLKKGDTVLVLPLSDESNNPIDFVVLGKVVAP